MPEQIRVALVGLDHWYTAIELAKGFAAHPEIDLVAIADRNEAHARQVAADAGVDRVTTDLQELIAEPGIDLIASMVTVDQNPSVVIPAARAGKHILSVKPLARTLEEATKVLEAVRESGVVFIPAETRARESSQNQELYRLVRDGALGNLVSGNLTVMGSLPVPWPGETADGGWWADARHVPGGGWIDHAIYHIDLLRWLLGEEVVAVSGRAGNLVHTHLSVEDYGHAILQFEGGSIFSVEDTWSGPAGAWRNEISLVGTRGAISIDTLTGQLSTFGVDSGTAGWIHTQTPRETRNSIDPIIARLRGEETALGTVEDAWMNLAASIAFYDAAGSGSTVAPNGLPVAGR
jgi:predicted dehydrogenase